MATDAKTDTNTDTRVKPLAGLKVVEFTHMVMGPTVGVILADLGAHVVKIEPLSGDNTRRLTGSGAGYFPMYNRNKNSLCIDLKTKKGKQIALKLVEDADIMLENFRPDAMEKLGFGPIAMQTLNPRLIYCSLKGFLTGPYEKRTALDEVAQMMGGLAYMTGLPDKPMRAGSSVIDITGGMFGVIGILAALEERRITGKGRIVTSSLYETTAFMVGQHMAQQAVLGVEPQPMSVRQSAWSVYDIFHCKNEDRVFVGVVSDTLWKKFCQEFDLDEFANDSTLDANNDRVKQRERIMPTIKALFATMNKSELTMRLERAGIPFAPINKPSDLFDDPQLNADGLIEVSLPSGEKTRLPALPIELDGQRMGLYQDLPRQGENTDDVLKAAGYSAQEISQLKDEGIVAHSASS